MFSDLQGIIRTQTYKQSELTWYVTTSSQCGNTECSTLSHFKKKSMIPREKLDVITKFLTAMVKLAGEALLCSIKKNIYDMFVLYVCVYGSYINESR